MKVQIYSQWMEDVYIPVRVKQFTKAAKLSGHSGFSAYADSMESDEREAIIEWLSRDEVSAARFA